MIAVSGLAAVGCTAAPPERDTAIRVSFNDGQLLVGDMTTPTFTLETALGTFDFDPAQIGELGPVEGADLGQSDAAVSLWLRDGSEYSGVWTNPAAAVRVVIGRQPSSVTLPIARLERMQFTGDEIWPDRKVVRVITTNGNDFLVDAERTSITIESELGTFSPLLDEVAELTPPATPAEAEPANDDSPGRWRVRLTNGAVLVGPLTMDSIVVYPALGPAQVTVPVAALKLIRQETWSQQQAAAFGADFRGLGGQLRQEDGNDHGRKWFSNRAFQQQKLAGNNEQ